MKRKTAKEILSESFMEIAAIKSVDKITVQEIVDNCGYSPATFYRNFRDKYDLIAWKHTRSVAEIMSRINTDTYKWKQTLRDGAAFFHEEKEYLINLLKHTNGHDFFVNYMVDINYEAMEKYIFSANGNHALDREEKMLLRTYCLGTVCLTCEWLLGQHKATPNEIADIYEKVLPEPLKKYLLK